VLLVALVGWATARLGGVGAAAAVAVGLGTLVLPFATLFFSHVLAACVAFAVFALLLHERRGPPRLVLVAAAGGLAGLGVMVEYPVALAGAALGVYALTRGDVVRRGAAYAAGVAAGVAPLLAHNTWAYGSPFHLTYEGNQTEPLEGLFGVGVGLPKPGVLADLLVSAWGLLPNMPVLACGAAGLVLLWRSGARAEAGALLAVPAVGLLYDSMLEFTAFGGLGLPRYLIYTFPFLAIGVGTFFRHFPLTALSLGAISVFQMTVMTATNPLAAYDGHWLARLGDRAVSTTGASVVGITGWYAILPFFAAVVFALAIAVRQMRPFTSAWTELPVLALSTLAWAVVAWRASNPVGDGFNQRYVAVAASSVVGLALVVSLLGGGSPRRSARTEAAARRAGAGPARAGRTHASSEPASAVAADAGETR
jgi:hypothetical protein